MLPKEEYITLVKAVSCFVEAHSSFLNKTQYKCHNVSVVGLTD